MNFIVNVSISADGYNVATVSYKPKPNELELSLSILDKPDSINDVFSELCSNAEFIKVVEIDRERLAGKISRLLTESVLYEFSKNDTIMGYKVKMNEEN